MAEATENNLSQVPILPVRPPADDADLHPPADLHRSMSRKKPPSPMPSDSVLSVPFSPAYSESSFEAGQKQPFWKFHMIRFGQCMYLSTNPTSRHLHCRNAPGYFVRDEGEGIRYKLVFEDTETAEPLVVVQRNLDKRNSELEYVVYKRESDSPELINMKEANEAQEKESKKPNESKESLEESSEPEVLLRGSLRRTPIAPELVPVAPTVPMVNYETQILRDSWSLGAIPRTRESRLHGDKYIGKHNVYFHQAFQDLAWFTHRAMPPVLAVYRECEASSKKRLLRQWNRLSRTDSVLEKVSPYEVEASPYDGVKFYYKAGDGLYGDGSPADDEPDYAHKLGWVTVYDDKVLEQPGMFDLAVALTVAVQHERKVAFGA